MCAVRINSNVEALRAQRQASTATRQVERSLERLSSGLRINRASDDAAWMAIATELKSDARVLTQALRNVSDGISVTTLASSALTSLSDINTRMRELAEQGSNGVYTNRDRAALDKEFQELIKEHNRIVDAVEFNGIKLFGSDSSALVLQLGGDSSAGSTLSFDVASVLKRTVGDGTFGASISGAVGDAPGALVSGDLNADGRADVVTANTGSGNISVMLGQADGTVGSATNTAVTAALSDLTINDFNGDGVLDLATADSAGDAGSALTILLGTGSGTFTTGVSLGAGNPSIAVVSGDVNNDGRADLVSSTTGVVSGSSVNFTSGSAEVSTVTTPAASSAPTAEISDVTIIGTAGREVTNITAATPYVAGAAESATLTTVAASAYETDIFNFTGSSGSITGGSYWTFNSPSTSYYVWYTVNGAGSDPTPGGTGIQVDILSGDTDDQIATKTAEALELEVGIGGYVGGGGGTVADGTFGSEQTVTGPFETLQDMLAFGDFNEDGKMDLLLPSDQGTGDVHIALGNGDGSFLVATTVSSSTNLHSVATGDFNEDGHIDFITTDSSYNAHLFAGDGTGGFTDIETFTGGLGDAYGLSYALDIDGDNNLDAIFMGSAEYNISLGNGNGTFRAVHTVAAFGTTGDTLDFGDIDNDTDIDIITFPFSQSPSVRLNNGDGTFLAPVSIPSVAAPGRGIIGQLTNDANLDIITILNSTMYAYQGNGDGSFLAPVSLSGDNYNPMAVGDVNADGIEDLVVTANSEIAVYLSNGNGTFKAPYTSASSITGGAALYLQDITGDGALDVLNNGYGDISTSIGGTSGSGTIGTFEPYTIGGGLGAWAATAADFDEDGVLDILINDYADYATPPKVSILLGNADGSFAALVEAGGVSLESIYSTGDVNQDGNVDIIGLGLADGTYTVILGNGNGTFKTSVSYAHGESTSLSAFNNGNFVGDVTGDGYADIVFSAYNTNVFVMQGNGNGTFKAGTEQNNSSIGDYVQLVDISNDGKLDIVSNSRIRIGNGDGTFQIGEVPEGTTGTIQLGDFNGDSEIDLLTVSTNQINVQFGNGNGTFKAANTFYTDAAGGTPYVAAGDLNGDGFDDVIASTYDGGNSTSGVFVYMSNGDGTFDAKISYFVPGSFGYTFGGTPLIRDFDNDGDDDIAHNASGTGGYVHIGLADEGGGFVPGPELFDISQAGAAITIRGMTLGNATNATIGTMNSGDLAISGHVNGATTAAAGSYFLVSSTSTNYYAWFTYDGVGTDPAVGGRTGIQIDLDYGDSDSTVASKITTALTGAGFSASALGSAVTITNSTTGAATDTAAGTSGMSVTVNTQGSAASGAIEAGDYFTMQGSNGTTTTTYNVWFRLNGAGSAPVNGNTNLMVDISSGWTSTQVATAIDSVLDGTGVFSSSQASGNLTVTNIFGGSVTDAANVNVGAPFAVSNNTQGTSAGLLTSDESYFSFDTPGGNYYVWINTGGAGVDPAPGGRTKIEVQPAWGTDATTLASTIASAINGATGDATANAVGTNLRITNTATGAGAVNGHGFLSTATVVEGSSGAGAFTSGSYFLLSSPTVDYYAWYNVDGAGGDPAVGGRTGIEIAITTGNTAIQVAAATAAAIDALGAFVAGNSGTSTVTITNAATGTAVDISNGNVTGLSTAVTTQGTAAAVNTGSDTITIANHGLTTGNAVQLSTTGTLPGGISPATTYYVIRDDANTIRLATSALNAAGGTAMDISSIGTGTQTITSVGSSTVPGTQVFLGLGNGQFSTQAFSVTDESLSDLALGDIDGDGYQDLLGIDTTLGALVVRRGSASGTFSAGVSYAVGTSPRSLAVADLNNDGLADVVTADSGSNSLSLFFGQTGGTLSTRTTIAAGSDPRSVTLGDVNGDGSPDILAAYNGSGTAGLFLNDRSGNFTAAGTTAVGASPNAVGLGDINGDGALDILAANNGTDSVSVASAGTTSTSQIGIFNIRTQAEAQTALDTLTAIQNRILSQQSNIGAVESRLASVEGVVSAIRDNYLRAESRISDADVAEETSTMIRAQILQQSAAQVLRQTTLQPQIALRLLDL